MTSLSRAAVALLAVAALAGCGSAPVSVAVPNVVGQALDAAKDTLVSAGFASYPQDLLRDRNPLLDSDWTVCRQSPGPVAAAAGSTVDLGVVKKAETCPEAGSEAASSATRTGSAAVPPTPAAEPRTAPTSKPQAARMTGSAGGAGGSGGSGGTSAAGSGTGGSGTGGAGVAAAAVHSGAFCDPPATGISDRGTAMVCAPAADGRNRWRRA